MVSFYRFRRGASCQNASRKLTIRVSSIQGLLIVMYPHFHSILNAFGSESCRAWPSLGLKSGRLQTADGLRGSQLSGIEVQLALVGGDRLGWA